MWADLLQRLRSSVHTRLIAGFFGAMLLVLAAAGAFVSWRVEYALDHRLEEDLATQTGDLRQAVARQPPRAALDSLRDEGRLGQVLDGAGRVLASGTALTSAALLSPAQARDALRAPVHAERGDLFSLRGDHVRVLAVPVGRNGWVAATAVRLDQRDEALRELLAQLAIANVLALGLASFVGYRLSRAALNPVERYRAQAERIAQGASGVRLDIPPSRADEITRLGATLNAMLEAQERSAQRQQQFIDDASHELRTPLTALTAEIELALRKPRTAEEYEATLRRLSAQTGELVETADTLLSLGALGSAVPTAEPVEIGTALEAAARRARAQLSGDGGRAVSVDAPEEMVVLADRAMLDRALGNLVDNAVRHGGGAISLIGRRLDGDGALIAVHDDGAGIDPEFLEHAAERFRQADAARTGPGAGLGLSLVDAIVTAHHGQLRICSAGHHHHRPATDPRLAAEPCRHPAAGTTVSLVLQGVAADGDPAVVDLEDAAPQVP